MTNAADTIPLEHWRVCVSIYVNADGDAKKAWKKAKKEFGIGWKDFADLLFDGSELKNLPPIHSMFLRGMREAADGVQIEVTGQLMATMRLAKAYKIVIAKKLRLLDADPSKVPNNIGQELLNLHKVEAGLLAALDGSRSMKPLEKMPLQDVQRMAEEAKMALARHSANDSYGLEDTIKVRGGKLLLLPSVKSD